MVSIRDFCALSTLASGRLDMNDDDWMKYRDRYVTVLLAGKSMATSMAFTIANRAADAKFGKRKQTSIDLRWEDPRDDYTIRRLRNECLERLNKLLVCGVFKNRREMNKWACENLRRGIRVTSFDLDECNVLLARISRLESM